MNEKTGLDDFLLINSVNDLLNLPRDPLKGPPQFQVNEWLTIYEGCGMEPDDQPDVRDTLPALSVMDSLNYDKLRERVAKVAGIRVSTLDGEVYKLRACNTDRNENKSGTVIMFNDPEPWPTPVDGNELFSQIKETLNKYVVLPEYGDIAITLWILHTWTHEVAFISPMLAIESPEKRCGKTTLLILIQPLARKAMSASNISPPALFRAVEKWSPTLLIDECDTFVKDNDELRGILNSGHTRNTAFVIRTVGEEHEPRLFCTWGPKALALIGSLPPTVEDRSIIIKMRRKTPGEKVHRLRLDKTTELETLKRKCYRWAKDNLPQLRNLDPDTPKGLHDRAGDNWRPLLAIADIISGEWPDTARKAAIGLSGSNDMAESINVLLLEDMEKALKEHDGSIASAEFVKFLVKMEERPWPEWYQGKPITPRQVAKLLRPFDIKPGLIRFGNEVARGYKNEDFKDAFSRYLSVTPLQTSNDAGLRDFQSVTDKNDVTDKYNGKSNKLAGCNGVTDKKGDMSKPNHARVNDIPFFDEEIEL